MKLTLRYGWGLTIIALFLALGTLLASTIRADYKSAAVCGAWFGYSEDQLAFLRLELDNDNTGYMSIKYLPTSSSELYHVVNWQLKGPFVELQVNPIDQGTEKAALSQLTFLGSSLEGNLKGKNWERKTTLFNEKQWQLRTAELRERIAVYRTKRTK